MTRRHELRIVRIVAVLLAATALCSVANAQQVGTASAVNPAATANMRTITIGQSIAHKEHIQTKASGSVQLLFLDKTSMTIGPNSDLTIDEYIFDPKANTGKLAATLGKGALRFVGGQISHNGNAEIKTASAVIGIRGGINFTTVQGGTTSSYTGYGSTTVSSGGTTVNLGSGEYTQTQGSGSPPSSPGLPPVGFVQAQVLTFQSSGGQGGGAPAGTASPARVAAAIQNASPTGTIAAAPAVNGVVQVAGTTQQSSTGTTTTQQNAITTTVQQSAQTSSQNTATQQVADQIVATQVFQRQFAAKPFALMTQSSIPYLPANFATGSNTYISPIFGYRTASVDANRAPFFQFGINITGTGASQSTWIFLTQGAFLDDGKGGLVATSGITGTRRGASSDGVGLVNGAISSPMGSLVLDTDLLPITSRLSNLYFIPETQKYVANSPFINLGNGTPAGNFTIDETINRVSAPSGLGDSRPAVTLTGFAGGLMRTFDQTANQNVARSFAVLGITNVTLDPALNRMQANVVVGNFNPSPSDTFSFANYQFGSLTGFRGKSAYVDYDNFAARGAAQLSDSATGDETPQSTVNGSTPINHNGLFVNVSPAVARQIASGVGNNNVNFCQCDYTRWGFWGGTNNRTDPNGHTVTDTGNLMTWVAGRATTIAEVPTSGAATYDGHVVASIKSNINPTSGNGNEYVAAAAFTNAVNFGTRTGQVTVSGLDNASYTGVVSAPSSDPRSFGGLLTGSRAGTTGLSMVVTGQFFRGASSPVGEMGGGVVINGSNYLGSGIFAAKMR